MNTPDISEMLDTLLENGVKQTDVIEALGIGRGMFNSWRASTKESRRRELAKKIAELYPEVFGKQPAIANGKSVEEKYIAMLEKSVEELKAERDQLKKENLETLEEIKRMLLKPT